MWFSCRPGLVLNLIDALHKTVAASRSFAQKYNVYSNLMLFLATLVWRSFPRGRGADVAGYFARRSE
jgi:hypothetical protein